MKLVMLKSAYWRGGCLASYELRNWSMRLPLCESHGRIVLALLANRYLTRTDMVELAWPSVVDQPDYWMPPLCLRIWHINHKLANFGYRIVWRQDIYRLVELAPERIAA